MKEQNVKKLSISERVDRIQQHLQLSSSPAESESYAAEGSIPSMESVAASEWRKWRNLSGHPRNKDK